MKETKNLAVFDEGCDPEIAEIACCFFSYLIL